MFNTADDDDKDDAVDAFDDDDDDDVFDASETEERFWESIPRRPSTVACIRHTHGFIFCRVWGGEVRVKPFRRCSLLFHEVASISHALKENTACAQISRTTHATTTEKPVYLKSKAGSAGACALKNVGRRE